MLTVSEKIRILARRKGIKQIELAAALSMSRQSFNNKLRRGSFSPGDLETVAAVLGCSVDLVFTDNATGEKL